MDLYHSQIEEGDITRKLQRYLGGAAVGHIQIAGVPDRHVLELIDSLGYSGRVGCEYRPQRGTVPNATRDGLGWMHASVA